MKIEEWTDGAQVIVDVKELRDLMGKGGMFKEFEELKKEAKIKELKIKRVLFPRIPQSFFGVPVVQCK
jgi:hypothetical protein